MCVCGDEKKTLRERARKGNAEEADTVVARYLPIRVEHPVNTPSKLKPLLCTIVQMLSPSIVDF